MLAPLQEAWRCGTSGQQGGRWRGRRWRGAPPAAPQQTRHRSVLKLCYDLLVQQAWKWLRLLACIHAMRLPGPRWSTSFCFFPRWWCGAEAAPRTANAAHCMQGPKQRIHSLAVHPSQPHLAASGASDGSLAIWDLRFERGAPPQQAALDQPHLGAVLKVRAAAHDWWEERRHQRFRICVAAACAQGQRRVRCCMRGRSCTAEGGWRM